MMLVEEILSQSSIDCVVWLLMIALIQTYNEKDKDETEKIQNVQFDKRSSREHNDDISLSQEDKKFKESPDAKYNKWKRDLMVSTQSAKL